VHRVAGIGQTRGVDDLRVLPGPGIPRGLVIPDRELIEQFSHASGPGGQGVNTTDSRVQLVFDVATTSALSDAQRQRLSVKLADRLVGTTIIVTASEHRSQLRNRAAARERLAALIRDALAPETPRRPTRPSAGSRRRRLEDKRQRSEVKRNRARPHE